MQTTPEWAPYLPTVNASLNALGTVFLVSGYLMIRQRRIAAHRACMLTAFGCSMLFLTSYLIYHYYAGSTPFPGTGLIRPVYFFILITHIALAVTVPPLAVMTLWRAWHERFEAHARLARWTLPIWLYVSVTGVIVYVMLYHLY